MTTSSACSSRSAQPMTISRPASTGSRNRLSQQAEPAVRLRGASKVYGDVRAVDGIERDVNTVFQDYALFPHMRVGDNVAYGLMVRKVPRSARRERVAEALRLVRLEGYEKRKPSELSGGQRQRVALARALVNRPKVLL